MNRGESADTYASITQVCKQFSVSRRTFYRMLARDPALAELVVRIPPKTGRIRVPLRRFEQWLRERQ